LHPFLKIQLFFLLFFVSIYFALRGLYVRLERSRRVESSRVASSRVALFDFQTPLRFVIVVWLLHEDVLPDDERRSHHEVGCQAVRQLSPLGKLLVLHLGDYLILLLNLCKICNICTYCSRFSLVNSANNDRVIKKTKENIRYYIFLKLYRLN